MTTKERVAALRRLMREEGLAAYLVPSTDAHQSEYVPEHWKRRGWLSGFTGSAGEVVVTMKEAGLWTDSRYFLQAEQELDPEVFSLHKMQLPGTLTIEEFLLSRLRKGQVVGVDPQVLSKARAEGLEQTLSPREIHLRFPARNLIDPLWRGRPPLPKSPIRRHADRFAGEKGPRKIERVRAHLKKIGADALVVSALDEIAWLFNIRGSDVAYNPLIISYALVTTRGASLFVDPSQVTPAVRPWLRGFARTYRYEDFAAALRGLARQRRRVLVDPATANRWMIEKLKGAHVIFEDSPVVRAKAVKNAVQLRGMQAAHVRDGVALVRFFHWLDSLEMHDRWRLTECGVAARLAAFRAEGQHYAGPSFTPIVGWRGNGAIVHYDPSLGGDARLAGQGLLLIDTGGQYQDGTTDVTRTVLLGAAKKREKELFTRVLQGTIRLSRLVFPAGHPGGRLEVVARQPLWGARHDYLHGTGHGVGHYLCVHEGPAGFAPKNRGRLEVGNVITIEPGHYEAGKFGIRTENMVAVVPAEDVPTGERARWLKFDTLTLCPIDARLIESALMEAEEIRWLNAYHQRVRKTLSPHLEPDARRWLAAATRPV